MIMDDEGLIAADDFLAKFSIALSWDYPDDWSLNDVLCSVFHIVDDGDTGQVSFNTFMMNGESKHESCDFSFFGPK